MTTEILSLGEMASNPSSPEVDVNTLARRIEGRTIRVISRTNSGPPVTPSAGDTYIVDSVTGDWSSFSLGDIAHYYGGAWEKYTPVEGVNVWVNDEDISVVYDSAAWVESPGAGSRTTIVTHDFATDANYTLTKSQYSVRAIKMTDTGVVLTTGRNVYVPDEVREFVFINSTAQTLTLKTSGGTGIAVATAKTAILLCDGTNVVRVTADA